MLVVFAVPGCIQDDAWAEICVTAEPDVFALGRDGNGALWCVNDVVVGGPGRLRSGDAGIAEGDIPVPGTIVIRGVAGSPRDVPIYVEVPLDPALAPPTAMGACRVCSGAGDAAACAIQEGLVEIPERGRNRYRLHVAADVSLGYFEQVLDDIDAGRADAGVDPWPCGP